MNEENNLYFIPLDGIDLNYLKTTLRMPNGKVMPLWSKRNLDMGRNEYYEFKFNSVQREDDDSENNTDSEVEDSEMKLHYTPCSMCDIDVPSTYLNEHYDSVKHKTNLKIVNTALERVKNSVNIYTKATKHPDSMYFCPVCVIVVEINEKKSHNKSVLHKNAVALEKIFEEFSNLYAKREVESDSDETEDDDSQFDEPVTETLSKNKSNSFLPFQNPKSVKDTLEREEIVENSCTVKENKMAPIVKTIENSQENEKINDIDELEKEMTSNFERLMMHFDKIPKNGCKTDIFTDIIDPVTDKTNNARPSKDTEIVNSTSLNINKSKIDTDTRKFLKNDILKEIDIKSKEEDSLVFKTHHHLEMTSLHVYCKICKRNIDFNDLEHTIDLKHKMNYENFIEENSLVRKDSKHIECRICKISFIYEDEILHCDGIRHITNYERFKKRNSCE